MSANPSILHLSGRTFWCGESNRVAVICRGLRDRGWTVRLGAPAASELARRAARDGVSVDTRFRFDRGCRPASLLGDIRALRQLQREHAFDIIHLHTTTDTWPAAFAFGARGRPGRPRIVRTRHNNLPCKRDVLHRWLYGRVFDHLVLAAGGLREPLDGLYCAGAITEDRVTVIHSSVNVHRFDPARIARDDARRALGIGDRFCIGLIGRLSIEKGHDLLLRGLPEILREEPRAVCLFAGEGDQEARLRREVAAGPLRDHVIFAGFRDDIPELVAAMDLLVVPSLTLEASPAVVKEGMAMGKPVIASDVGGVKEIIRHGVDGWIIPPGDAGALRDAVRHVLRQPDERAAVCARARARIVGEFSDEHLVERTMALYRCLTESA
jgi:glycosyltransferase involved in cell wall biosynthesis